MQSEMVRKQQQDEYKQKVAAKNIQQVNIMN